MVISTIALFSQICTQYFKLVANVANTHTVSSAHTRNRMRIPLGYYKFMFDCHIVVFGVEWFSLLCPTGFEVGCQSASLLLLFLKYFPHALTSHIFLACMSDQVGEEISHRVRAYWELFNYLKKHLNAYDWDMFYDIVPFIPSWGWALFFHFL